MRWISLSSGHSIQMQRNTPSSQVPWNIVQEEKTSWVTNQALVNLRKLKLYQAFFSDPYAMWLDINYRKKLQKTQTQFKNT